MASRKIEDLDPRLQPLAQRHRDLCAKEGIDLLITCTFRDDSEQDALWKIGRSGDKRPKVTWVRRGSHNIRDARGNPASTAYDVVPLRNGKCVWGTTGADLALWNRIGALAKSLGLEWGGDWKVRDYPHCQLPGGK